MDPLPPDSTPERLAHLPSWLVSRIARAGDRLVSEALAHDGVRKSHFAVLTALGEQGGISQAALGRRVWIDRSDLHALLNELEADGLVARTRDEADRRRNLVRLTPIGTETLRRLDASVDAAQDALLLPLSERERDQLLRLLERLVESRAEPRA